MKSHERQKSLLKLLESVEELRVEDACRELNASPATIRRDFLRLEKSRKGIKTWGGIRANTHSIAPFSTRRAQHLEIKRALAARAAALVQEGDTVMIDGGSTTLQLAPMLASKKIRIITNSLVIAHEIDQHQGARRGAEVFLTGGVLLPETGLLTGPQAEAFLRHYHARWGFLSVGGIDTEWATNDRETIVQLERVMREQCEQFVVLADPSKFGANAMCRAFPTTAIQQLVTREVPENSNTLLSLESRGIQILRC